MSQLGKIVGNNIRQIRKTKNLTQEELAEKSGLQTSYLAGVERGDRNFTISTLEKIILGLEILPDDLFKVDTYSKLEKNDIILKFTNDLQNKSKDEINLIINITNEIFRTYKGQEKS